MNKTLLTVLVAGVVLVGGYFYFGGEKNEIVQNTVSEEITQQPSGKKMAFAQFLKDGGAYKCTVNQYVGDTESKGTVYVNQGLIRGTFQTEVQGTKIDTDLLVRDGYTYTWTSAAPMGFKAPVVAPDTNTNQNAGMSGTYSWNAEQIGDYDCVAWNPDTATFAVPAGIQFMEMGDILKR